MKVLKTTYIEVSIMEQIEEHMKTHNIKFAEFIRRAVASYLDYNQTVSNVSINDSKLDEIIEESIKDIPKDTEPPPTEDIKKNPNGDFNFDDLKIE